VIDPATEMRRLVGKFAFLFSGVYLLVLFGVAVSSVAHRTFVFAWVLLLLPAAAFLVAVIDGFRLHRTDDVAAMKSLWPRCLLYLVIGVVLLIAAVLMVERMTPA
jgi:predicted outer membrane lipoprotein